MKKKNILITIFLAVLFMFCAMAASAAEAEPTIGDIFQNLFTGYVAPILGSAILILVTFYAKKLLSKFGITLSKEQEEYINSVAERLVRSAEEKAAKALKETGDKVTFTGSAKLASVVGTLMEKFPKLTKEEAEKIALAAVNKIPGVGLTGNA